jgi:hypothetical protein
MRRVFVAVFVSVCLLSLTAGAAFAAPPSNDDIGSPIVVPSHPYTNTQDTTEATTGPTDATDCEASGRSVWYEYTPDSSGRLEANTFGSNYDTVLIVGTPDGIGGIDVLACNDQAGGTDQSRVRWDAEAGTTYLFQISTWAFDQVGGSLMFNILDAPPAVPLSLAITVNGKGQVSRSGVATISGTVSCSGGDFLYLEVSLSQRVGRFIISGGTETVMDCADGDWQLDVSGFNGLFAGGKADASVFAATCNDDDCAFDFADRTVQLSKGRAR